MSPSWYSEMMSKTKTHVPKRSFSTSRMYDNPNKFVTRLLAVIGIVFLIERSASYYTTGLLNFSPSTLHKQQVFSHELDSTLRHGRHNTGVGVHGTKAIVVASTSSEDTSWVREHFPDWQLNIYVVDDIHANLTLFKNRGREAAVYLTYIINHYSNLPDYVVFLHADRYQWHNDDPMYDGVNPVKNLRLQYVKEHGYANLRCAWTPGCRVEMTPEPGLDPEKNPNDRTGYGELFQYFFPDEEIPTEVGTTCCAQFAVTKEQILQRPVWQYERIRQWLWETKMGGGRSGRVLEYMWHVLMKQPSVNCPTAEDCYCNVFGHCNLTCVGLRHCEGRYHLPPWNRGIPKGWPFRGQGTSGYPKYNWWQKTYPDEDWGLGYIREGMDAIAKANETGTQDSTALLGFDEAEELASDQSLTEEDLIDDGLGPEQWEDEVPDPDQGLAS